MQKLIDLYNVDTHEGLTKSCKMGNKNQKNIFISTNMYSKLFNSAASIQNHLIIYSFSWYL